MRSWIAIAALLAALCACSGGGGGSSAGGSTAPPVASGASREQSFTIDSLQTGISYRIVVRTPPGYAGMADRRPAVYAMDLELEHAVIVDAVDAQDLGAIVASVSYVTSDRRFIDYTMTGGEAYFRFIKLELVPFVEARFGVDPSRRALVGYSLSGLFVSLGFLMDDRDDRMFSGILASDPSFQYDGAAMYAMEQALADSHRPVRVRYAACHTTQAPMFLDFYQLLRSREYAGFEIRTQYIAVTHGEIHARCIPAYLGFVLGK